MRRYHLLVGCNAISHVDLIVRYTLLSRMFKEVTLVDLWQGLKYVDTPSLPEMFQRDALLALLKFADGMIHDNQVNTTDTHLQVKYFIPILRDLVDFDTWIPSQGYGVNIEKLECTTSCIQLLLGIFQIRLEPTSEYISREDCIELVVVLIGKNHAQFPLLTEEFLGFMHKRFLVQGLAPSSKPDEERLPWLISDYFKGMKRDVIIILTLLMGQEKEVQNTIRDNGGIPLILAQTNIDDDNPCKPPVLSS